MRDESTRRSIEFDAHAPRHTMRRGSVDRLRPIRVAIALGTLLLAALDAQALEFRVTELSTCPFDPNYGAVHCIGVPITIGLRIEAGPGENLYGLGASAWGYDESVVDFTSGQAISSIFHAAAIPAVGVFSGLTNSLVPAPVPGTVGSGPLSESAIGASGNRVLFFLGAGFTATNYNTLDPGLDGVTGGGGTQFRFTFTGTGPGTSLIHIGTGYTGDGAIYAGGVIDQSAGITIVFDSERSPFVVPEPGTALLLGLGLAALAANRRDSGAR